MKLIIEGRLPSLNDYIDACRSSRNYGAAMKKKFQKGIIRCILEQGLGHIDYAVKVKFKWYEKNRMRDFDNVSGFGHKVIMDALVESGVLTDDGWNFVSGYEDSFYIDRKNPRIEVEIEDAKSL